MYTCPGRKCRGVQVSRPVAFQITYYGLIFSLFRIKIQQLSLTLKTVAVKSRWFFGVRYVGAFLPNKARFVLRIF